MLGCKGLSVHSTWRNFIEGTLPACVMKIKTNEEELQWPIGEKVKCWWELKVNTRRELLRQENWNDQVVIGFSFVYESWENGFAFPHQWHDTVTKTTAIPNTCRHLIANLLNEHCSPFDQVTSIALSLPQTHWKDF